MLNVAVGLAWVVTLTALSVAVAAHVRLSRGLSARTPAPLPQSLLESVRGHGDEIEALRAAYTEIEGWRADITIAVAEGIKNVERAENRIRATVRRAREELAEVGVESPGLEAEARDLRLFDGGRGEGSGVPAVREDVGQHFEPPAGFAGSWHPEHLQRLRGA